MSVSSGVMSSSTATLDAALNELGMLSTITNSRQEYLAEKLSRYAAVDIPEDYYVEERRTHVRKIRSFRAQSDLRRSRMERKMFYSRQFSVTTSRFRTKSENESDVLDSVPLSSSNLLPPLSPVLYSALPIDTVSCNNLFKSRSMESIDARASDESVCLIDTEMLSNPVASLTEVDCVSSGLDRLNVSE